MAARILKTDKDATLQSAIKAAARLIRAEGVVAIPTESFYGLAVHGLNQKAIERLFAVKRRQQDNPLLLLIASREALGFYVREVSDKARRLMDRFWPGGLTMVFLANPILPRSLTAGTGKIGVRLSSHPVPRALAEAVGAPITGTSANRSGQASCLTAEEVMQSVGEDIDLILDGGRTPGGIGSTVLDVTLDPPVVVREGIVSVEDLKPFLS